MADLEQQLTGAAPTRDCPSTPALAGVIQIHLPARRGGRPGPQATAGWGGTVGKGYQRRFALAAAAAVLIAAAGLLAFPPSRQAIAGWVNVHTIFRQVPHLATPSPQPPGPLGTRLGLGGRATLADAQRQISWPIAIPSALSQPHEAHLQPPPGAPAPREATVVY